MSKSDRSRVVRAAPVPGWVSLSLVPLDSRGQQCGDAKGDQHGPASAISLPESVVGHQRNGPFIRTLPPRRAAQVVAWLKQVDGAPQFTASKTKGSSYCLD